MRGVQSHADMSDSNYLQDDEVLLRVYFRIEVEDEDIFSIQDVEKPRF